MLRVHRPIETGRFPAVQQHEDRLTMMQTGCYLTVELQDYKQTTTQEMGIAPISEPARTLHGVARILSALAETSGDQHATIFATGQIARDQPELVAELAADGHEIGCHGDRHEDVRDLDPGTFATVLMQARASIVDACGIPPEGFRAPNFSIDERCPWALEVLASAGFSYDSSIVSSAPRNQRACYDTFRFHGDEIRQYPIYRHELPGGIGIPVIDGTSLRILPMPIILRLMRDVADKGYPLIVHVQPADLDEDFDPVHAREMEGLGLMARLGWMLRQTQSAAGTGNAYWKLKEILTQFPNIGPMGRLESADSGTQNVLRQMG